MLSVKVMYNLHPMFYSRNYNYSATCSGEL